MTHAYTPGEEQFEYFCSKCGTRLQWFMPDINLIINAAYFKACIDEEPRYIRVEVEEASNE